MNLGSRLLVRRDGIAAVECRLSTSVQHTVLAVDDDERRICYRLGTDADICR